MWRLVAARTLTGTSPAGSSISLRRDRDLDVRNSFPMSVPVPRCRSANIVRRLRRPARDPSPPLRRARAAAASPRRRIAAATESVSVRTAPHFGFPRSSRRTGRPPHCATTACSTRRRPRAALPFLVDSHRLVGPVHLHLTGLHRRAELLVPKSRPCLGRPDHPRPRAAELCKAGRPSVPSMSPRR